MPPPSTAAHPGGSRRRRKGGHGGGHEEGGSERWLVTYADMLTLLLVLFIVLFSVSVVNTAKFISLKTSLASVFGDGNPGTINAGGNGLLDSTASGTGAQQVMPGVPVSMVNGAADPGGNELLKRTSAAAAAARRLDEFHAIQKRVQASLLQAGSSKAVRFAVTSRGLVITVITNALVFGGNSADLLSGGTKILATIAPPLAGDHHDIEVDGYTNQAKVSTAPYPSGWELSSARASSVVRYLAAHHVAESRLTAVGFSDQHPLYPAGDPRSITLNRRVEIVVLNTDPRTDQTQESP